MKEIGTQDWTISKIRNARALFWEIPEMALAKYNSIPADLRLPFNPRISANVLNGYVIDEARKRFAGMRNSEFFDKNSTTYHLFNGCVFWYKQLGDDGCPSNYPTETALEMMQGRFSFAPSRPLFVLGFKCDDALRNITSVVIQRYYSNGKLQFYIELEKVNAESKVVEMPSLSVDGLRTRTQIRIKRGPEQKELLANTSE
jgi:hypothetical protein